MKLLNSPCIYISAKKKHTQTGFVVFHKSICKDILEGLSNTINMGRTHRRKYSSFLLFVWEFNPNNVWRKEMNLVTSTSFSSRCKGNNSSRNWKHMCTALGASTWPCTCLHRQGAHITGCTVRGETQNDVLSAMASELPITELKQGSQSQVPLKTTMCRASRYHQ